MQVLPIISQSQQNNTNFKCNIKFYDFDKGTKNYIDNKVDHLSILGRRSVMKMLNDLHIKYEGIFELCGPNGNITAIYRNAFGNYQNMDWLYKLGGIELKDLFAGLSKMAVPKLTKDNPQLAEKQKIGLWVSKNDIKNHPIFS